MFKLYKEFDYLCIKPIENMERKITIILQEANIITRPGSSNGLWCPLLLPMVLLAYSSSEDVSILYKITTLISVSLLGYSLLFLVFLSTSSVVMKKPVYSECIPSILLSAVLMYTVLKQGLFFSLLVTIPSTVTFAWLLRLCVTEYQRTFTLGEAMIVCQSLVLFVVMSVIKFFFKLSSGDEEMEFINVIVFMVLSTVGLIVAALYHLNDTQRNLKVLSYIVLSAAGFLLLMLYTIIGADFMTQILGYVFMERSRVQIFTFWLVLLILAVCSLLVRTKLAVKATTVTRKTFHVLAALVFMSGILYDKYYMLLAAGIGLGVLVVIEALRKSGIEPISSALQSAFLVYCDEKDCGVFAMTPLYLYTGLAAPLLLAPTALEQLSGVLAVGVGDTAASWFGSRLGLNKWPQSSKTLEGTAFNVLSQIGTVYALTLFGLLSVEASLARTCLSASVCGLVEALTDQVDNLVLPLVTLLTFRVTSLMSFS